MKYQYITSRYNFDGSISMWGRGEDYSKREIKVIGFLPYFYVDPGIYNEKEAEEFIRYNFIDDDLPKIVNIDFWYPGLFGEKYAKITCTNPNVVKDNRVQFEVTGEADIKFLQRFLIDTGITSGFYIENDNGEKIIDYTRIKPCKTELEPLVSILDIEVHTPDNKFPDFENPINKIIATTVFDTYFKKYLTLFLPPNDKNYVLPSFDIKDPNTWRIWDYMPDSNQNYEETELVMLLHVLNYFSKVDPDLIGGWNVDFDLDYLFARIDYLAKKYKVFYKKLTGFMRFDLLKFYKRVKGKSFGNRLKDVVIEEEIVKIEDLEASEYDNILYDDWSLHFKLLKYNKNDIVYPYKIMKKFSIDLYYWKIFSKVGLYDINNTLFNSHIIDRVALMVKEGLILPTAKLVHGEKYKGAINFPPTPGLFRNVGLFDFTKHFPLTIIMFNYSPEYAHLSLEERLKKPLGILGRICQFLITNREEQDLLLQHMLETYGPESQEYKVQIILRNGAKFLLNAAYGVLGYKKFRLHNREVIAEMVAKAMEGLIFIRDVALEAGYKTIHGHTDGIMLEIPRNEVENILELLNTKLKDYAISLGVEPLWDVKYEMYASHVLFPPAKSGDDGTTTTYAAYVVEKDGVPVKPYVYMKGFDRGDNSKLTKRIRKKCFEHIFTEKTDEFVKYVRKLIKEIKTGNYRNNDICVAMNLGKNPEEYNKKSSKGKRIVPYHVRAVEYSRDNLGWDFKAGDRIRLLPVKSVKGKPQTDVIAYGDEDKLKDFEIVIDYDTIIEKTLKAKLEDILGVVNVPWREVEGIKQNSLLSLLK
jgi:DNA polymerase elongation subunit (family B)